MIQSLGSRQGNKVLAQLLEEYSISVLSIPPSVSRLQQLLCCAYNIIVVDLELIVLYPTSFGVIPCVSSYVER